MITVFLSATSAAQAPEFDLGRVIFIILLLLGGFFQWLVNWWKTKRAEAASTPPPPPTAEEMEAREREWRRQTGEGDVHVPPPPARNPLEELLETFREMAAPPTAEPEVAPPPAIPQAPARLVIPGDVAQVASMPQAAAGGAVAAAVPEAAVRRKERHPLAVKLEAIGGLREAIVLREVFGPPKALQSADERII